MNAAAGGADSLVSRRDLRFLLYEWLDVASLAERPRYAGQSREAYDEVLELAERLATDLFAPHNRAADVEEPRLEGGRVVLTDGVSEASRAYADAGLLDASLDLSVGGCSCRWSSRPRPAPGSTQPTRRPWGTLC
ncbi:MAG: acyl-CoA dehydrogenase family protein [Solirubrobacterales bacterium]